MTDSTLVAHQSLATEYRMTKQLTLGLLLQREYLQDTIQLKSL